MGTVVRSGQGVAGPGPAVATRGLCLSYARHTALSCVDLEVPRGAVAALVGSNGSGKTSLLHVLAGLLRPDRGDVDVLGRPPGGRRRDVALVLQHSRAAEGLPVTAREVVRTGRWAHRGLLGRLRPEDHAAVDRAMESLEVTDLADRQLHELSGGQRQRVLVAQALAQEADLVLLDEPVTGLDLASAARISEALLAEARRGRTVVLSTHDLDEAETCDHVVVLAGCVVAAGPPHEVVTEQVLRRAYGGRWGGEARRARLDEHVHP